MQIFLVRHAEAVDETLTLRDPQRHLTPHGRLQARALGDRMRWHDCHPTHVWSSPLVRAVQTAEIAISAFGAEGPLEIHPGLVPEARVSAAAQLVDDHVGETLALVGHQPLMGALAAFLLGLGSVPAGLEPGAILALDLPEAPDDPAPRIAWHLRPGEKPQLLVPPEG